MGADRAQPVDSAKNSDRRDVDVYGGAVLFIYAGLNRIFAAKAAAG